MTATQNPPGRPANPERMRRLVKFIQKYSDEHGYAPNVREMAEAIRNPENTTPPISLTHYYLSDLKEYGVLTYAPGLSRTVRVLDATLIPR